MRILGVDYGEKRIGFAVSDPAGMLAMPLAVCEVASDAEAVAAVQSHCTSTDAELVVVGLPLNMDGTRGPMALKTQAFAAELGKALAVPVATSDERLTTALVERTLLEADLSRAKRKRVRDKLAAQAILQNYLDARAQNPEGPSHGPNLTPET